MDLVFSSFVFGSYQKYIPYYIYSICRTHPDSFTKVFIEKNLEPNIQKSLSYLKNQGFGNFEVIELKATFETFKGFEMKGGGIKTIIRYLIGEEYFKEFEYVYVGDIDILFLSETINLLEFHKKQMRTLNLPFSNKVRLDNADRLTKRLTGLHFFQTEAYFEKITPIISRIRSDSTYRTNYLKGLRRDEEFLYKMNLEAFSFDPVSVSKAERPWHGLHLGITRGNKDLDIGTIEENSSLNIDEIKYQLRKYLNDPIFKEIQKHVFVIELEAILRTLSIPYNYSWRYKGFKYRMRYKMKVIKRKVKEFLR